MLIVVPASVWTSELLFLETCVVLSHNFNVGLILSDGMEIEQGLEVDYGLVRV